MTSPSAHRLVETQLPTRYGTFRLAGYRSSDGQDQLALALGQVDRGGPVLARLHSECMTGDVFGSCRCDCGEQLASAMLRIQEQGRGVLLYLRQEGRGIGLINKLRAYALQDQGLDTVEANRALGLPEDVRDYGYAAAILRDLGVHQVRLLTNNPAKIAGLEEHGIEVVERLPLPVRPNPDNLQYLRTKEERMGHLLSLGQVTGDLRG
ncbi:MAG TPA: GTP cyclohydrolase II [Thermomicrobiales bacterium]|nr:GTP cyclohydrolase II [Thermomicrobiales bacterium]